MSNVSYSAWHHPGCDADGNDAQLAIQDCDPGGRIHDGMAGGPGSIATEPALQIPCTRLRTVRYNLLLLAAKETLTAARYCR